ncbi:MAG TPA: restriction endonuclease [Opitutaceae bacterium]|nr:restriction endonuclease [Opitutaceae bacterium]
MLPSAAVGLRACCFAVALIVATAYAADPRPFIGATRAQVVERLGEPKSAIVAGSREVLFFARDRLVLRDGVVIEYEPLPAEQPRQAPPAETAPAPDAGTQPTEPAARQSSTPETPSPSPGATPAPAPAPGATRVEIKSVRPPTGGYVRPSPKSESPPLAANAPGAPAPVAPAPTKAAVKEAPAVVTPPPVTPKTTEPVSMPSTQTRTVRAPVPPPEPTAEEKADNAAANAEKSKKAKADASSIRRRMADASVEEHDSFLTANTFVIAGIVIFGGIAVLVWQTRQRRLELAASAVSSTPFNTSPGDMNTARFKPELLAKLEWKRFEELVASYYSKTGVMAARTKAGPTNPVHIKISWKGEPRPFAYVQCIPQTDSLIEAGPILELVTALTADDIRRGYVVTTGKFSVNARDIAEEKHITLLPGDIFLEKLNALPDAARVELMQETKAGDYTTPSCPKCEAKMVPSGEDPNVFKCAAHPDQVITVRR